jgi:hypothetical protein
MISVKRGSHELIRSVPLKKDKRGASLIINELSIHNRKELTFLNNPTGLINTNS